jgi:hypothetical protein
MAPDVVSTKHLRAAVLEITFADGMRREVDIAALVRPEGVFRDIDKPGFVASGKVNPDTGTIEWPSGGDLSPELLYQAGKLLGQSGMAA